MVRIRWIFLILMLAAAAPAWGAGAGMTPPEFTPAEAPGGFFSAPFFSGEVSTTDIDFPGTPSDVAADSVFGQPDMITNEDSGASRTRIGYPMGSAYYIRKQGEKHQHYLFVADEAYHRVVVYDSADNPVNGQPMFLVIGQPNFDTSLKNAGRDTVSAYGFEDPTDIAVDKDGNLYVADYSNHRVLIFRDPISTDTVADYVLGQGGDFTAKTANFDSGPSDTSMNSPVSVAVDEHGNLFVAEELNHRITVYFDPLNTGLVADRVIGQADFTTKTAGVSATRVSQPFRVRLDPSGNLYLADFGNSRGVIFNDPLNEDAIADLVIGQPNPNSNTSNNGGRSANSISSPCSLGVDAYANLYMADWGNNRVLFYKRPLAEDTKADVVFGQNGDFTTNSSNAVSATALWGAQRIDFDPFGNVYVSDCYNSRVVKYTINAVANICAVPWITTPQTGKAVSGNAVSVIAHLDGSHQGLTAQFQYRKTTETAWTNLGSAFTQKPYLLKWNTTASAFSNNDTVQIRVYVVGTACDTAYSLPVVVTINRNAADIVEDDGDADGKKSKKQKLDKGRKHKVEVSDEAEIEIPSTVADTDLVLVAISHPSNPHDTKPSTLNNAAGVIFQEFTFESGPSTFDDSVAIEFDYSDTDQNGVIDGTEISETTVSVYWYDTPSGNWQQLANVTVNADSNTIKAYTTHFTLFAVFGSSSSSAGSPIKPSTCVIGRMFGNRAAAIRDWRDRWLATRPGRAFVKIYYR